MSILRRSLFLAVVLVFSAAVLLAQTEGNTGQIVGTVFDPNGAVVPNVKVTLTNLDTGAVRALTTNESGQYRAVLLQAGRYKVVAEAAGFATSTAGNVVVNVGTAVDVNFSLKLGTVAETVEVSAPLIEVTRSESGAVIDSRGIQNLPINGRRFQDLIPLAPTTQVEGRRGQISILGQRGINTSVNVDGNDYNEPFFGGIRGGERSNFAFTLPQDAIAEFQVVTSAYAPEFGRSTGGLVTAITKSGQNDVHGGAFYVLRQKELGVKNKLQQQSLENRHQYGGNVGGPLRRDRMFFFGAAEQQIIRSPRAVFFPVLRTTARTAQNAEAWDYFKSLEEPFTQTNDATVATGRFDYQFRGGHRFSGRYNHSRNNALNATSVGNQIDPFTTQAQSNNGTEQDRTHTTNGQLISLLRPTLTNELRFQFSREMRPRLANASQPTVTASFGRFGTVNFLPTTLTDDHTQISDNLGWQKGSHSVKLGFEYVFTNTFQQFGFNQFGNFSTSFTSDVDLQLRLLSAPPATSNNRFDNASVTYQRQLGNLLLDFSMKEAGFFVQDSWRIRPGFTLNYGFRWEGQYLPSPDISNTSLLNRVRNTSFAFGKVDPGVTPSLADQFMPRLGLAWDPARNGKNVIRANFGIFYAHTPLIVGAAPSNNFRTPPGDLSLQLPLVSGDTVYKELKLIGVDLNTFSLGKLPILTLDQLGSIAQALGVTPDPYRGSQPITWATDFKNPRSVQWGFGYEREVAQGFSAYSNFYYSNTVHLERNRDMNLPLPYIRATDKAQRPFFGLRTAVAGGGQLRPQSLLDSVTVRQSSARSLYRAWSIGTRYNRKRLQFGAHYTLGWNYSSDDNERDAGGFLYENGFNLRPEYNYSELDARHTFVAYGVLQLPWGLEVSNSWRLRSALPFSPVTGADTNEDRGGPDRSYQAAGVPFPRNSFRNLAFYNSDLRLLKGFRLWNETSRLQFSAEFFNLFNFANFSIGSRNQIYGLGVDPATGNVLPAGFNPGAGGTLVPAAGGAAFRRIIDPLTGYGDRNNTVGSPFQFQIGVRLFF